MEEQDNIGNLFRSRLENAEVTPSEWLKDDLMRRVARKEFFRFNPSRINIYYVSFLLLSAATAFILTTDVFRRGDSQPVPGGGPDQATDSSKSVILQKSPDSNTEKQTGYSVRENTGRINSDSGRKQKTDVSEKSLVREDMITPRGKEIFSIKGLFNNKVEGDINRLQGRSQFIDGLIETSMMEGCAPLKIKFSSNQGAYDTYQWSFGEEGSSSEREPEWIFNAEGEYTIELIARQTDGSYITSSTMVTVHPRPIARFEIRQPGDESDDKSKFINYSLNAARFRWHFGDGSSSELFEPEYRYSQPGIYDVMLIASSENGCADSLIVKNDFKGKHYFINFPNAFIPNTGGPTGGYYSTKSDESAQVFHPVFSGIAEYQLKIYSKIGILIFETNEINVGWDGYFKGQMSEPGVYVWEVRGRFVNDQPFTKRGDVTLLKY